MRELVSIVTTLYNYRRYIGDLIASVINQSYENWELIIVDDASTDDPERVIKPFVTLHSRICYIRLSKNKGYSAAKNQGIKNSKGQYIVMIDADDMLTPDSIELRKNALDQHPEKLWCHGEVLCTDNGSNRSERSRVWKRNFRKKLKIQGMDLTKEYHHRLIHAQSVMVKPKLHKIMGLYDPTLRFSSDNEMWRRVIRFGHIPVHIEDFVSIYRVHPDRMSRSKYKREHKNVVKARIVIDVEKRFREGINPNNTPIWK